MTKEELEKEAITRVDAFIGNFSQDIRSTLHDRLNQEDVKDFLYGLYIDSAKPREKRIAELEAQIEKMKNCNNCGNYYTKSCLGCEDYCNWKLEEIKENDLSKL